MSQLYPLKFTPIQQEKIWGGTLLNSVLHKQPVSNSVGESWEVSAIEGFVSVVSNGAMKGKSLQDILDEYPKELLGQKVYKKYNKTFPLLIKFIDAREDLSVQLHPDDVLAQQRHNSLGKEEMWYIVQADKDSKLYLGFNQELNKATLLEHIQNKTLPGVLHQQPVTAGDVFHITPGLVHSIGGGILLAEIQQSSDVTYRLYDWDRTDDQGKSRTLHIEESLDAIDYDYHKSPKIPYEIVQNRSKTLVDGDYFKTDIIAFTTSYQPVRQQESFVVYMCVEGKGSIRYNNVHYALSKGEAILIPSCVSDYEILSGEGTMKLLEVTAK